MARKPIQDINDPGFFDDDNLNALGVDASGADADMDFVKGLPDHDGNGMGNASRPIDKNAKREQRDTRSSESSIVMPGGRPKPGDAAKPARNTDQDEDEVDDDDLDDDDLDDDDLDDDDTDDTDDNDSDDDDDDDDEDETPKEKRERLRYASQEEAERAYREQQSFYDKREAERQQQIAAMQQQLQAVQTQQQQASMPQVSESDLTQLATDNPDQAFMFAAQNRPESINAVIGKVESNATHYDVQATLAAEAGNEEVAQECATYANYLRSKAGQMRTSVYQALQQQQQQPIVEQHQIAEATTVADQFSRDFPRSAKYNDAIYAEIGKDMARFRGLTKEQKYEFLKDTYHKVYGRARDAREAERNAKRRTGKGKVAGGGLQKGGKRANVAEERLSDDQKEALTTRKQNSKARERSNAIFTMGRHER